MVAARPIPVTLYEWLEDLQSCDNFFKNIKDREARVKKASESACCSVLHSAGLNDLSCDCLLHASGQVKTHRKEAVALIARYTRELFAGGLQMRNTINMAEGNEEELTL